MVKRATGATPALVALTRAGVPYQVHEYVHAPGATDFGAEAARELEMDPTRIFKTLLAEVDGVVTVAVVPVSGKLDLKALAAARNGKRATMADVAVAETKTGYVVGGVSPIGQRTVLPTVIDSSARNFSTIFVSAGRRGLDIELDPKDLLRVAGGMWAEIGKS